MSGLGFELANDPNEIKSPFAGTIAEYKTERGLYLRVAFELLDSNSVLITFGRCWLDHQGSRMLSNTFRVFAKRFGKETPQHYKLGFDKEIPKTIERVLDDLRKTLPTVMEQLRPEDLIEIEGEGCGARKAAMNNWGPAYAEHFEISPYPEA